MLEIGTIMEDEMIVFRLGDQVVAQYVIKDCFKPYFNELKSPAGHSVILVSPGDHRHHKGLMYALKTESLNFWEEEPDGEECGRQRVISTVLMEDRQGFIQELQWEALDGSRPTYKETRKISIFYQQSKEAIIIEWETHRVALCDHRLVMSPHAMELEDGRRINYHGLGVRLPWMWNFPNFPSKSFNGIMMNGQDCKMAEAMGSEVSELGFWGAIDGHWDTVLASLTIRQIATPYFTWFVLKGPFAYLSVGPSNRNEITVSKGQCFTEQYEIEVQDRGHLPY